MPCQSAVEVAGTHALTELVHVACLPVMLLCAVGVGKDSPDLESYPFIATGKANYSPGLTVLLSQQAAWQMLQLQPQLLQLLNQTNATVQPV
jgi:hypothetical protein